VAAGTQTDKAAAAWLARMDREDWSAQSQVGLAAWLAADTAHRVAFLRLRAAWDESGRLAALGAGDRAAGPPPRGHWQPVFGPALRGAASTRNPSPAHSRKPVRMLAGIAAVLVVSLLLGVAWQHRHQPVETTYRTAIGDLRDVRLEDGSLITLSSASVIRVRFARRERHIELDQGEAFFDVAKDRNRPFVIVAGERRVRAIGTRFAVRRGDAGAGLRVVVTPGPAPCSLPAAWPWPAVRES
jgi:transmembrane sensor